MRGRAHHLDVRRAQYSGAADPRVANARLLEGDKPWSKERLPLVADRVRKPLDQLSARLGEADWLDGAFSAGDLMMVSVLLRLRSSGILDEFQTWLPMSPAVKRGPPTSGLLPLNWRSTPAVRSQVVLQQK
jgi:glutathione S-transferase